jgi:hypothetical protein
MSTDPDSAGEARFVDAAGFWHIFRSFRIALQPSALAIALCAIVLTYMLGTVLDVIWTRGGGGVTPDAIEHCITAIRQRAPFEEAAGGSGIFRTWLQHERRSILGLLSSSVPGSSLAVGSPVGAYMIQHTEYTPLENLSRVLYGMWWLMRYHLRYFVLFGLGSFIIWCVGGGGICRAAAMQFCRDEKPTAAQVVRYSWDRLAALFFGPAVPLGIIAFIMLLMVVCGLVVRVPLVGDLLTIVVFPAAMLGGLVISLGLVGLLIGGSMFWPAVGVDGVDAFDSFNRAFAYTLQRPWKTILYAVVTLVYAGLCCVFVNLFTFLTLSITQSVVGFGTSPFGLFPRGDVSKLRRLWPDATFDALYTWPAAADLSPAEYLSAFFVGVSVLLVIALMWSFLASFFFTSSTIAYCLLRRDVDGTDLEEMHVEDEPPLTAGVSDDAVPPP